MTSRNDDQYCLDSAQIQAVADREAAEDVRAHAASCARCAQRVREREGAMAALVAAVTAPVEVPQHVAQRMEAALSGALASGATRLRSDATARTWSARRRTAWSAAVAAAATLVGVLFIAPLFRDPTVVSASEILAASARRLAQSPTTGVEVLEYELVIDGVPKEMMPDHPDGAYRVWQAIDHDTPGRFRFASFGPDGRLISSIAQDPAQHRRVMVVTLEGQPYRFDVTISKDAADVAARNGAPAHGGVDHDDAGERQSAPRRSIETPEGRQYRIEVQHLSAPAASPVWDLTEARVLVDAADYRITEFAVTGTFLKQPYSLSYKLISARDRRATSRPTRSKCRRNQGRFSCPAKARSVPARDAMVLALRELARLKQAR